MAKRVPTSTTAFGTSRREAHDSSAFYDRFEPPELRTDRSPSWRTDIDRIFHGSATSMTQVDDDSVALVVTSPPYFVGKEYEQAIDDRKVPTTYLEYLDLLEQVFAECVRKLEPGGRIAVNVANLGRRPFRSLSSDVVQILERRLRLLLRGEVIWVKARGAGGSCAWGSFQKPGNPVLRDLTERVIIASKERFDRAVPARQREADGRPSESTLTRDEFMEATTDVWEIPAESATRVGHPAPYPVALPERLIHLNTYRGDLVLDPFMGSGSTAIAAIRTGRHYVGYDLDAGYVARAEQRIHVEHERLRTLDAENRRPFSVVLPTSPAPAPPDEDFQARASREGRAARDVAADALAQCGFSRIRKSIKVRGGIEVNFAADDDKGVEWLFDVSGGWTSSRPGLERTETLWKALGKAAVLHATGDRRLVLLTTNAPRTGSAGAEALDAVTGRTKPVYDVIVLSDPVQVKRLRAIARGVETEP